MTARPFDLSDRERTVLAILIDHYIRTAEPVGSRVLATRYNLGVSPATIRNTLSDLEEIGLSTIEREAIPENEVEPLPEDLFDDLSDEDDQAAGN